MSDQSFYERLNLRSDATPHDISKAYRRILMDGKSDFNMHEIEEAYEVLISKEKRLVYDNKLLSRHVSQRSIFGAVFCRLAYICKAGASWVIDSHLLIKAILLLPIIIIIIFDLVVPERTTSMESSDQETAQTSILKRPSFRKPTPSHQIELTSIPSDSTKPKSVPEVSAYRHQRKTRLDKLLELSNLQLIEERLDVLHQLETGELGFPLDTDKAKRLTIFLGESLEYFGLTTADPVKRMRAGVVAAMMASGLQDANQVSEIINLISKQNETAITRKQFQLLLERLVSFASGLHSESSEIRPIDQVQRINFLVHLHQLVLANHFSEEAYDNFLFPVFTEVESLINEIDDLELEIQKTIHTELAEIFGLYSHSSVNPTLLEFSIDIKELIGILTKADADKLLSNRNQLEELWDLVPDLAEASPSHPNLSTLLGWYTGIKKSDWQASQYYFTRGADSPLKILIQEEQRLSVVDSPYESDQLSQKFFQLSERFVGAKKQLLIKQAKSWVMK